MLIFCLVPSMRVHVCDVCVSVCSAVDGLARCGFTHLLDMCAKVYSLPFDDCLIAIASRSSIFPFPCRCALDNAHELVHHVFVCSVLCCVVLHARCERVAVWQMPKRILHDQSARVPFFVCRTHTRKRGKGKKRIQKWLPHWLQIIFIIFNIL